MDQAIQRERKVDLDKFPKEEAERIAWKTSGIWHVKNELLVDYEYAFVD